MSKTGDPFVITGGTISSKSIVLLVAILCVVIGIGILTAFAPWYVIGATAGFIVLIASLLRPGLVPVVLLFYVWLVAGRSDPGDILEAYPIVRWATYVMIPVVVGLALARMLKYRSWQSGGIEVFIALLIGIMALSSLLNDCGPMAALESIGVYLRYPILFLALINLEFRQGDYKCFLRTFMIIGCFIAAEALVNYALLGKHGDSTFFTLGLSHGHVAAGFFLLYGCAFVLAHGFRYGVRWYHLGYPVVVGIVAWIAAIRSFFPAFALLILVLYIFNRRGYRPLTVSLIAITGIGMVLVAVFLPWQEYASQIPGLQLVNPTYRFESIREVLQQLADSGRLLLGFGPRSFSPGSFGPPGEMYDLLQQTRGLYFVRTVSLSQLNNGFAELGVVGFVAYWFMLLAMLLMNLRFWVSLNALAEKPSDSVSSGSHWSVVSLAFFGIWFHYAVLGLLYYDLWRIDVSSLVFWITAAAVASESYRRGLLKFTFHRAMGGSYR